MNHVLKSRLADLLIFAALSSVIFAVPVAAYSFVVWSLPTFDVWLRLWIEASLFFAFAIMIRARDAR